MFRWEDLEFLDGWMDVRDEDRGRFCCSIWFCWKERGLYGMKPLERALGSALSS